MAGVTPWLSMMTQTLSVAPRTGVDGYGVETYSTTPSVYQCRLVGKRRMVRDANGQQVVSNWTAYLGTAEVISPGAKVTLSTADVGSTEAWAISPLVIAVGTFPDENGPVYTALYW